MNNEKKEKLWCSLYKTETTEVQAVKNSVGIIFGDVGLWAN